RRGAASPEALREVPPPLVESAERFPGRRLVRPPGSRRCGIARAASVPRTVANRVEPPGAALDHRPAPIGFDEHVVVAFLDDPHGTILMEGERRGSASS